MTATYPGLCLAIDTASDIAGAALFEDGALLAETTWYARQAHSRQLLPAIDWLLGHMGREKHQIGAIAVSLGPGSYAGMRVGLSTAKALAYALEVPLAGVGRLAADAVPVAEATACRVVAVQAAGRAELAWAAYQVRAGEDDLEECVAPGLIETARLPGELRPGDAVTGEIDKLDAAVRDGIEAAGARLVASYTPRAVAVARLGLRRLARGVLDNPDTLVPLYLRAPAIGPQPPR